MTSPPRRILIANHQTAPLPDATPWLTGEQHAVFESSDVLETIEAIRERRLDLILLAPLSGNAEGPEVGRILEALEGAAREQNLGHVPVLLVLERTVKPRHLGHLAAQVDDILARDGLTGEILAGRLALALGRLLTTRRLEEEKLCLERQSITDFKTGTFNDRYFHRRLREEFSRSRRHHTAISCVMLDFDNFKEINDTFDHAFGDFVLLAFAKKLRTVIRDIDIPARFGGDEFVLLLPSTGLDEAVCIAERIRTIVADYEFERQGQTTSVTLSMGIATYDGVERATPEEFLRRADCALLEAKRRGRNRVVLYPQIAARDGAAARQPEREPPAASRSAVAQKGTRGERTRPAEAEAEAAG